MNGGHRTRLRVPVTMQGAGSVLKFGAGRGRDTKGAAARNSRPTIPAVSR